MKIAVISRKNGSVKKKRKKRRKEIGWSTSYQGETVNLEWEGKQWRGTVSWIRKGWVTILEMWVIVEYVRLSPAACESSVDDTESDFLAVKNTRRDYRRAFPDTSTGMNGSPYF